MVVSAQYIQFVSENSSYPAKLKPALLPDTGVCPGGRGTHTYVYVLRAVVFYLKM